MESPARSDAVLELGKRLVTQLELGDDLLAQWMAHDLAARIDAVERAGAEGTMAQRDDCERSIVALWERRQSFPRQLRPFREIEPLMRTLVALDVDSYDHFRYLGPPFTEAAFDDTDPVAKRWLELAFGLDYAARALIQYALRLAAESAASREEPWVEAAARADLGANPEKSVIRFVLGEDTDEAVDAKDAQQKIMRERVAKLESFASLAGEVAADLRAQLEPDTSDEIGRPDLSPDTSL